MGLLFLFFSPWLIEVWVFFWWEVALRRVLPAGRLQILNPHIMSKCR